MTKRTKPADSRPALTVTAAQLTEGTRAMLAKAGEIAEANGVEAGQLYMHRGGVANAVDFAAEAMRAAAAGDLRRFASLMNCAHDAMQPTQAIMHTRETLRLLPMREEDQAA